MVLAIIYNTSMKFNINQEFANNCITYVGSVIKHNTLGKLFCDELIIDNNGNVSKVIFIGTSKKNGLRNI